MKFVFPAKINLAQLPTPIQHLSRLSQQPGWPQIFVKRDDLTGIAVSGNKVRKLEFIAAQAMKEEYEILITCGGIQSNHARATAAVAAQLGLQSHLVLRGEEPNLPEGNLLLDLLVGAQISYLPDATPQTLQTRMEELAAQYAEQGQKALVIPMGASNVTGTLGYIAAVQEMTKQFRQMNREPDYIVTATGSGGTLAGLILGKKLFQLSSQIIGINVCDAADYFHQEIARLHQEFCKRYAIDIPLESGDYRIIDGYVGRGYALSRPEELRFIARVAQTEGVLLDPTYTGKAFYGLAQEIERGHFSPDATVLFLHTGGVYGLFPQAEELTNEVFRRR